MKTIHPDGQVSVEHLRVLADAAQKLGAGYADLTVRREIQLAHTEEQAPALRQRLEAAGLTVAENDADVPQPWACPVVDVAREACATDCAADHLGITAQKQTDLYTIGVPVPVARLTAEQMKKLADMTDRYATPGKAAGLPIRLTVKQNVILAHIPEEQVEKVLAGARDVGLTVSASAWRRSLVVCTGGGDAPACAQRLVDHLETRVPLEQPLRVHVESCARACTAPQAAELALIASPEGYDIVVGGRPGPDGASFSHPVVQGVPSLELPRRLERLLDAFRTERQAGESFAGWCARVGDEPVIELLTAEDEAHPMDVPDDLPVPVVHP